jgi:glycosyltransferase involved in cell wall biosynthesis
MKIAIAIRLFSPEIGGVEGVTRSIASGLARSGHDVHVFTSEPNECALEGVTVHKVRGWQFSSIAKTLSFPYFAKKAIAKQEFDIVHAFSRMTGADIYRLADPPQAAHLRRNYKGFKSIFAKLSLRNRTILRLELDTYNNYQTTLVTNSYRTRRDLERYCEVDGSRVSVIRNGVDTERFPPQPARTAPCTDSKRIEHTARCPRAPFCGQRLSPQGADTNRASLSGSSSANP